MCRVVVVVQWIFCWFLISISVPSERREQWRVREKISSLTLTTTARKSDPTFQLEPTLHCCQHYQEECQSDCGLVRVGVGRTGLSVCIFISLALLSCQSTHSRPPTVNHWGQCLPLVRCILSQAFITTYFIIVHIISTKSSCSFLFRML